MAWLGYYNNALTNTIRIGSKSVLVMFSMEVKMGTTSPLTFIESSGTKVRAPLAVPILVYGKYLSPAMDTTAV